MVGTANRAAVSKVTDAGESYAVPIVPRFADDGGVASVGLSEGSAA